MIASTIVACAKEGQPPVDLHAMDSDLACASLETTFPIWLFASPHNPGANRITEMILERVVGLQWSPKLKRRMMVRAWTTRLNPQQRRSSTQRRSSHVKGQERGAMLLYLNSDTFADDTKAELLAKDVRAAKAMGAKIVTVHEQRPEEGGSAFKRFFIVTPPDLIADGIYKKLAIPIAANGAHLAVSMALVGFELGAKGVPGSNEGRPERSTFAEKSRNTSGAAASCERSTRTTRVTSVVGSALSNTRRRSVMVTSRVTRLSKEFTTGRTPTGCGSRVRIIVAPRIAPAELDDSERTTSTTGAEHPRTPTRMKSVKVRF